MKLLDKETAAARSRASLMAELYKENGKNTQSQAQDRDKAQDTDKVTEFTKTKDYLSARKSKTYFDMQIAVREEDKTERESDSPLQDAHKEAIRVPITSVSFIQISW